MFSDTEYGNVVEFSDAVRRLFAFTGFLECPLSESQIVETYNAGFDPSATHAVGCDVFAGYEFEESFQYAKEN